MTDEKVTFPTAWVQAVCESTCGKDLSKKETRVLLAELFRILTEEAITRAHISKTAEDDGDTPVDVEHLEQNLPQLLLDFQYGRTDRCKANQRDGDGDEGGAQLVSGSMHGMRTVLLTTGFPYENSEATVEKDESFDSTIVVTQHDAANYREDSMPRNQRNQIPRLEAVPEATPLRVLRRGAVSRIPVRRPECTQSSKGHEGNISSSNIVAGARNRRQTPANVSTHMAVDNGGSDGDGMTDGDDELRYTDICLFTRVLQKPEKVLRQIPDVVQARTKEVEGLYDVGCLEWATWSDADKDRIKPIRTGFVDAIKAYSHADMGEICYAIPPDDFRDPASQFPPGFADDVRSMPWRLQRDDFRFTDKGDVEVFCGTQFKRRDRFRSIRAELTSSGGV
eukprot:g44300.t1